MSHKMFTTVVNYGQSQVIQANLDIETSCIFQHNHSWWYNQCAGYTTVFDQFKVNYEIKQLRLVDNKFWTKQSYGPVTMFYAYDEDGASRGVI